MSRLFLFTAIIFSSLSVISAQIQVGPVSDDHPNKCIKRTVLDSLDLSAEGRAAVYALLKAERFETGPVGFAGSPSAYIKNFQTILREPDAAELFKYLSVEATTAGKLYAVSGLYLTDQETFRKASGSLKTSIEMVPLLEGCLMVYLPAGKIVESDAENVAIIEPGKTMKDFRALNAGAYIIDIAHGGYPATFAEFADTRMRNLK